MRKPAGFKEILTVLIAQFELRGTFFAKVSLGSIKFVQVLYSMRTGIIAALMDGNFRADFPDKKRMMAIRAEEFSFF